MGNAGQLGGRVSRRLSLWLEQDDQQSHLGGGVGYGPGGAVGASLVLRDQRRLPVGITGDGDFLMGSGAIWTAVHYQIPTLLVINNNNSWGNDEHHQIRVARKRDRPPENAWIGQRMTEPAIDFADIARGYGAWAAGPVEDPDNLATVFRQAVAEVEAAPGRPFQLSTCGPRSKR